MTRIVAQAGSVSMVGRKGAREVEGSVRFPSLGGCSQNWLVAFTRNRCFHIYISCFVTGEELEKKGNISMQEQQGKLNMWIKNRENTTTCRRACITEFVHLFNCSNSINSRHCVGGQEHDSEWGMEPLVQAPSLARSSLGWVLPLRERVGWEGPLQACLLPLYGPTDNNTTCPDLYDSLSVSTHYLLLLASPILLLPLLPQLPG